MTSDFKKNKGGSVYILALTCAVVLVALIMGMSYQLLQFRSATRADVSAERASIYAELGVRHALHFTRVESLWRQMLTSGQWLVDIPVDQANVGAIRQHLFQRFQETIVELHGHDLTGARGQRPGQAAESRADLQHDIRLGHLGHIHNFAEGGRVG